MPCIGCYACFVFFVFPPLLPIVDPTTAGARRTTVKRSIGRRQLLGGAAALAGELHPAILDRAVERSSLGGLFEQRISTDRNKTFKPDPRAYQLAADAFRLDREQILFV